jgi:glucose/arabinose dehydrogenase
MAVGAAACGSDEDDPADRPIQDRSTTSEGGDDTTTSGSEDGGEAAPLADISLSFEEIGEFDAPISIVDRVDDTNLYVAERPGRVVQVAVEGEGADASYTPSDDPVVDISDQVTTDGERGLLDIAFSPDGATLYVSYSALPDGTSTIVSYDFDGTAADEGSRKEILTVSDFADNHNGGDIEFGPDGFLYIAMGDGGGSGDPENNGQDNSQLLGKILRIDPEGASGSEAYAIPADNPYADGADGEPEIFLYGVRNPWRYTFDRDNGDLYIADVGQGEWEEINVLPAADGGGLGANLGWSEMEGAHVFEDGSEIADSVLPVYEYNHDEGCSITGGVVYRGTAIEGFAGAYVFADYCQGIPRAIRVVDGQVTDERSFDDFSQSEIVSFGQDDAGEVYMVSLSGPIYRLEG